MKRERTEVRQQQIADAALKVIAQQGLRRFTAAAIAREVGISDGTLFRHFPNKAAIVTAALNRAEAIIFEGFPPQHPDPLERLGLFFHQRLELVEANPAIVRLAMSDQLAQAAGGIGAERVADWKARSAGFIRECLEEAQAAGSLRAGVSTGALSLVVLGSILSVSVAGNFSKDSGRTKPAEVWATLMALVSRSGR
ncbi:MAG: TetR/AcrR family transcriptional regulator [Victivallales bacterium]|jgi:AcrR family transcriptional regulator|nr:TetR/AcrR family transcriptional regulator [Victivallales bacterium]